MKTKYIKSFTRAALSALLLIFGASTFSLTSCSDEPASENYYVFNGEMVSDYLDARPERFSEFVKVLHRSGMYGMMATYGAYTCLAPTNEAIELYLKERGLSSVDELSKEECDTLSWNHILKKAFFTTSPNSVDGSMPPNFNDRNYTFSTDSDAVTGQARFSINKLSHLIVRDDSVENGVVHTLDHVIVPANVYLAEIFSSDPDIKLFTKALQETGLANQLYEYEDLSYSCGTDSVNRGMTISTGGSEYKAYYVGHRLKRFTAFVEKDEVFAEHDINTFQDLVDYATSVYEEVYPNDTYDPDTYTDPKHPLYRFVAYHLLPYYGDYNDWTIYGEAKEVCASTDLIDCTDWYTTLMPGTIMKMSTPVAGSESGLYINRKGVGSRYTVRGVRVLAPSESGEIDRSARNGIYHYIDDILTYNVKTRDNVFNDRIRINAVTLSPEFMNCGARHRSDQATGFKMIEGWDFHGHTPSLTLRQRGVWMMTYSDAVDLVGQFDVSFKLPPVPENTYEIRFAYGAGDMRGVVQVFFGEKNNMKPMGIPIDLRVYGGAPYIGWVADEPGDEEANRAIDKAMHNRGYMKDMDSWKQGGQNVLRDQPGKLRKILCTQTLSPDKEYWVRMKLVLENPKAEFPINYFELCPKSVYAGVVAEDTH